MNVIVNNSYAAFKKVLRIQSTLMVLIELIPIEEIYFGQNTAWNEDELKSKRAFDLR